MNARRTSLRPYRPSDEACALALWQQAWEEAYPQIDFAARLAWWTQRWREELVPGSAITVCEIGGTMAGFVTVAAGGYLDQIVVAPEHWGAGIASLLIAHAQQSAPSLTLDVNADNHRAIRFYLKHGFVVGGEGVNPRSGAPTLRMAWRRPVQAPPSGGHGS